MILASEDKQGKIRFFKSSEKVFCDACESILKNPQLVSLYALYVAIKNHKQKLDWFDNFRHVRNLIEFSDDELGHSDRLHNIFIEIENIIAGRIAEINSKDSKFNTTQYSEELVKNKNIDVWKGLFEYENHDILRGSLTLFAHPNDFSLENSITAYTVSNRLEKFAKVFDNNSKGNDQLIRAYLLSIGDFSQQHNMNVDNRMVGRQYNSWRIIFTKNSYYASDSIKIMSVLDKVDITKSLVVEPLSMDNWRYYATCDKYRALTYASYNEAKYGYYYFKDLSKPLEVWLLQSTSCSENNVMWKLLNNLLYNNLLNNYSSKGLTATYGKYQEDHTVRINGTFTIDALQEGWMINDNSDEQIIMKWLESNTNINNSLIPYTSNVDHIEEMSSIIKRMIDDGLFQKIIHN